MRRASAGRLGPFLLVAALVLAFLTMWIAVPAPTMALLPFGVLAPELSPWLLLASAIVCALAAFGAATRQAWRTAARGVVILLSGISTIVAASPLLRLPSAIQHADAAMQAAFGADYLARLPPDTVARLPRRAFAFGAFVRGLSIYAQAAPRIARGIEFARPAGEPLRLDVYRPAAAGRYPIVVQIYGGAWQRGAPDANAAFARTVASNGYVLFAIDYRHAPAWRWPAQRDDVAAALRWVLAHAAEYDGDATRIALLGRSSGAQLALLAAYDAPPPGVRAVVSFYGPSDLAGGWQRPPTPDPLQVRAVLESYLGGTPDTRPDAYRDASPITYVSAASPPTLLLTGARDHIVDHRFVRDLDARLRAAGAPCVLIDIPWAEHAFDALPHGMSGQLAFYYTMRFLAVTLR